MSPANPYLYPVITASEIFLMDIKPHLLLILVAALVGGLMPVQGGINAQLGQLMKHPLQASFISFLGGVITLALILFIIRPQTPGLTELRNIPWYLFTGGILGALFVTTVLVLIPQIGTANMLAAAIFGQLTISLLIDHYGWLGVPVHSISWNRVFGVFLLLGGVYFIQR